jgi:CheY-like chemotaxis protein
VRLTVLIVDDHEGFRQVARALLEADGIQVVGEAADGGSAITEAARLRPRLVLLDVQLPGIDGFEVAARLSEASDPRYRPDFQLCCKLLPAAACSNPGARVHPGGRTAGRGAGRVARLRADAPASLRAVARWARLRGGGGLLHRGPLALLLISYPSGSLSSRLQRVGAWVPDGSIWPYLASVCSVDPALGDADRWRRLLASSHTVTTTLPAA